MTEAAENAEGIRKAVTENRERVLSKAKQVREEDAAAPVAVPPEKRAQVREDVDSIELAFPDGTTCTMRPARSVAYRVATIISNDPALGAMEYIIRALLAVRVINGNLPPDIENKMQLLAWMEQLGDDNLDLITTAYRLHWPPLMTTDLRVIKKNLRQS